MSRKPLSQDDIALFRDTVGEVRPVACDRAPPARRHRNPYPRSRQQDDIQVMQELLADVHDPEEWETGEELLYLRPGLQHGVFRRLRRGQLSVGAELDLHGMTVPVARQTLQAFLNNCAGKGIRCVRIVHGKGNGSQQRHPVLKGKVNLWLRHWDRVLAFCSARPHDGGTGAVYVLLKGLK